MAVLRSSECQSDKKSLIYYVKKNQKNGISAKNADYIEKSKVCQPKVMGYRADSNNIGHYIEQVLPMYCYDHFLFTKHTAYPVISFETHTAYPDI